MKQGSPGPAQFRPLLCETPAKQRLHRYQQDSVEQAQVFWDHANLDWDSGPLLFSGVVLDN